MEQAASEADNAYVKYEKNKNILRLDHRRRIRALSLKSIFFCLI